MAKILKPLFIGGVHGEHCVDIEQLKGYFQHLSQASDVYKDLLDYSKSGDLESWLEKHGEEGLARKVAAIDKHSGDAEYMNRLKSVFAPEGKPESSFLKPRFEECVRLEISDKKATHDEFIVELSFEILSFVNEVYKVKLEFGWRDKGFMLCPADYEKLKEYRKSFTFREGAGKKEELRVLVDGDPIWMKAIDRPGKGTSLQSPDNKVVSVGAVSFEMVYVEGGMFRMGATEEQGNDAYVDEELVHSVTLSSYLIGKYEVTQALWEEVMGSAPSGNKQGGDYPVECVSWVDCQEFGKTLNARTGMKFRLPTEAEWEYAARGGSRSKGYKYAGSDNLDEVGWYEDNSDEHTHPVGRKKPNELGLYDMSGNVWEWCQDWYGGYTDEAQTNPAGPQSGKWGYRVLRGGSYWGDARYCRVSCRNIRDPGGRYGLGLRLVLSL